MPRDVKGFVQMEPLRQTFAMWLSLKGFAQAHFSMVKRFSCIMFVWKFKRDNCFRWVDSAALSSHAEALMICFIQLKVMSYWFCTHVFSRGVCQWPRDSDTEWVRFLCHFIYCAQAHSIFSVPRHSFIHNLDLVVKPSIVLPKSDIKAIASQNHLLMKWFSSKLFNQFVEVKPELVLPDHLQNSEGDDVDGN